MKIKPFLLIWIVLICGSCFAQNQNSIIKTQAMEMAKALLKKDFPTFSKFMHPHVITMAGGRDKMLERMDTMNAVAKQFGAEIKKVLIGNPGPIIKYKKEFQVTLPQTTEMKTGFGNLTLETTLIAISKDRGKSWYFIDTSVYNVEDLKKALPELSPSLVIPPAKPPKFTPNQD
ncbi:MAG: hypothetical protein WKF97_00705 [Chitinophagaceae bacterium]